MENVLWDREMKAETEGIVSYRTEDRKVVSCSGGVSRGKDLTVSG